MNTYINYDLRITQLEEDYHLRADCPLAGQETWLCAAPFSAEEIQGFLRQDIALSPKEIGQRLYDAIFQENIGIHLRTSLSMAKAQKDNLRIRLHLNESSQLALLPWEYLYDTARDDFFALSIQTPIVRYLDMPIGESSMKIEAPLHILVMIADPVDLRPRLDVEREWILLRAAFQDMEDAQRIRLHRLPNANKLDLQRYLRGNRIDIFHFIGHGYFDEQDGEGNLIFEDSQRQAEQVSADTLARLLKDKMPNLVYLNSCDTAQSGPYDPLTGTAQKLVLHGIPAVVAMQSAIQDDSAIQIAHEFYLALTDGYPVDAALVEGRKAAFNNNGLSQWGTPVLFMRAPDGILWDQRELSKTKELATKLPQPKSSSSNNTDQRSTYSRTHLKSITLWVFGLIAFLTIAIFAKDSWDSIVSLILPTMTVTSATVPINTPIEDKFDCTQVSEIPPLECEALVALYEKTGGPDWSDDTGWLVIETPCNWYGVVCLNGNVTQLELSGEENPPFGLTGDLPPEIDDFVNLNYLNLSGNELSTVPTEIGRLPQLRQLNIGHNKLSSLPKEIGNLSTLEKLYIGTNALESVPAELGRLSQLTKLDLHKNRLNALPAEIGRLNKLTELILSNNNLKTLPAEIGTLSSLDKLILSNNNLKTLPAEIGNLSSLSELNLSSNKFSTWPVEINTLSNLKYLDLSDNILKTLPAKIGDLSSLKWLKVADNQLSSLPAEIGALSSLYELNLNSNEFSTWPVEINNLPNLENLALSYNPLKTLPADIGTLSNLKKLYLYDSSLETLPAEIGKLSDLHLVHLGNNNLRTLPAEIGKLLSLKGLHLGSNNLQTLPVEIGKLSKLEELDISWNHLTELPEEIGNLINVEDLKLEGNHLVAGPALRDWMNAKDPDWADNQRQNKLKK